VGCCDVRLMPMDSRFGQCWIRPWRLQSAVSMYSSLRWGSFFQLILRVPGEV